jgi:1-acyl-sn-glycerol-3-phosphate acyltransferase
MSGISYEPPTGQPLGTNKTFQICTAIVIPLLRLFTKRQWSGMENIPKSGPAIVASNHVSYADVIFLAQYLYENGRAPRFIGKRSVFDTPIIGRIVLAAGQIPVDRQSGDANKALDHAVAALKAGHLVGIYPEGTLTRDENLWPMVAKTGLARLAIITRNPIITYVAGTAIDMSPWYGKEEDPQALAEATAHVMKILTSMVASIRGENPPSEVFDPHTSDLPRTGNFKKAKKK